MKLILGLGNPGAEYINTRHNAGVVLVDKIYELKFMSYEYGFRRKKDISVYESNDLVLAKTANIFMNESGRIIQELRMMNCEFDQLYVAHDDLDLKLGEFKIQFGKGPKDHHGIESVEGALGTKDFWRIRIGIDNRAGEREGGRAGEEYVLQKFTAEEKVILDKTLDAIVKTINSDQKPGR